MEIRIVDSINNPVWRFSILANNATRLLFWCKYNMDLHNNRLCEHGIVSGLMGAVSFFKEYSWVMCNLLYICNKIKNLTTTRYRGWLLEIYDLKNDPERRFSLRRVGSFVKIFPSELELRYKN